MPIDSNVGANVLRFLNPYNASGVPEAGGCTEYVTGSGGQIYCQDNNYMASFGTGDHNLDIWDKTPGADLVGLVLQATFATNSWGGQPWQFTLGVPGSSSYEFLQIDSSQLQYVTGRPIGTSTSAAVTNQYNDGYIAYIYLNIANYQGADYLVPGFPGVADPPPGVFDSGEAVRIPISLITQPAPVIFNVYGVRTCSGGWHCVKVDYTNPNSSTYGVGFCATCLPVPEPATMTLVSAGLAGLLLRRLRRAR
jgi:hypothetical protein